MFEISGNLVIIVISASAGLFITPVREGVIWLIKLPFKGGKKILLIGKKKGK